MRKPDAEGSAKTLNPKTTLREGNNVTPTASESPHCQVGNRDQIGRLIGPRSAAPHPRNQEPDRHPQTARPRLKPARPTPKPTAK